MTRIRGLLSTALTVFLLHFTSLASAAPVVIDFDAFSDSTVLSNQIPGLAFLNLIVLKAGVSLSEFDFPPKSGLNVISDYNAPITISFLAPVSSVSGF